MNQSEFYQARLQYETDAADLYEQLKNNQAVVAVDARSKEAYEAEHIPSAVSFPHRTMSVETVRDLDKTKTYVTYCDGVGCNASTKAAIKLTDLGFHVRELPGGLDWWKRDGYATEGEQGRDGKRIACGC